MDRSNIREIDKPTEKQLFLCKKLGIQLPIGASKFDVIEIIKEAKKKGIGNE